MKAYKVLRAILDKDGLSPVRISRELGLSELYLSKVISRKANLRCESMARWLNAMDYDLIARSRHDNTEFIVDSSDETHA